MSGELVTYEAARHALAEAHRVDEVKQIRNKAAAMAEYARRAKDRELIVLATEIREHAERRVGELLRETARRGERQGRGRIQMSSAQDVSPKTLKDLGITRNQSSAWQRKAALPAAAFAAHVERKIQHVVEAVSRNPVATSQTARVDERMFSVDAWARLSDEERTAVIASAAGPATFNRQSTDSIDWAWWSWNPVTGCLHNCAYCYARDIAERRYPQGFAPTFLPDRLVAPVNTLRPDQAATDIGARNVFVCSMADLFGKWVPEDWIAAVFDQVRQHPEWNFLFLTKFPQRLAEREWPDNAWCGTTVDTQERVRIAEKSFRDVKAGVKWLSVEPMLERLTFSSLEMFNWIVVGGASASTQTPAFDPPLEWVRHLLDQVDAAGITGIYAKPNLHALRAYPARLLMARRGGGRCGVAAARKLAGPARITPFKGPRSNAYE